MGAVFIKHGRAHMRVDMATASELEAAVRRIMGPAVKVAEDAVDLVHEEMLKTWPVKTGASRKSFKRYLLLDPARYRAEVGLRSDDPDVRFIKSTKQGRFREKTRLRWPLQTDVRRPIVEAKREVLVELHEVLTRHLQEVFRE